MFRPGPPPSRKNAKDGIIQKWIVRPILDWINKK